MRDIEEKYLSVQKLIYFVVYKFRRKYGGDFSELLSEANEHFIDAYNSYDPEKGEFSPRISFKIYHNLLETVRRKAKRKKKLKQQEVILESLFKERFDIDEFILELSEDSKFMIEMVMNILKEMEILEEGDKYKKTKSEMLKRLEELGWEVERIVDCFVEIRENL